MVASSCNAVIRAFVPMDPQEVWEVLVELRRLAAAIPEVRQVDLHPGASECRRLVDWTVWLKGFELHWQEEQSLEPRARRIEFHQTQGMFAVYRGSWQITELGEGAQLEMRIEFDSGLPHLSSLVNPVLLGAFEAFGRTLISACADLAVGSANTT